MEAQLKSPLWEKHLPRALVVMVRDIFPLLKKKGRVIMFIDTLPLPIKERVIMVIGIVPLLEKGMG